MSGVDEKNPSFTDALSFNIHAVRRVGSLNRTEYPQGPAPKIHYPSQGITMDTRRDNNQYAQWLRNRWDHSPQQPQQPFYNGPDLQHNFAVHNYNNSVPGPTNFSFDPNAAFWHDPNSQFPNSSDFMTTLQMNPVIDQQPNWSQQPGEGTMLNGLNIEITQQPTKFQAAQESFALPDYDILDIGIMGIPIGLNMFPPPRPIGGNIPSVPPFYPSHQMRPPYPRAASRCAVIGSPRDAQISDPESTDLTRYMNQRITSERSTRPSENTDQQPRAVLPIKNEELTINAHTSAPPQPAKPPLAKSPKIIAKPSLPSQLTKFINYIYETEEERKQAEFTIREVIKSNNQETEAKQNQQMEEQKEFAGRTRGIEWPGDPSRYPAECYEDLRLPGCEYRPQAICVGTLRHEWYQDQDQGQLNGSLVVYAVRPDENDVIEFRLAQPGSSLAEVRQNKGVQFRDIKLNGHFVGMDEEQVTRWTRFLLAAVPGTNDSMMMWSKA
ncbi:hypothetical protein F5Y19DRAFT_230272 [Xylariaceae sp. FL1651]|nr:hypothetical protein F5Y19DRAFT_230272 [Xylariaceae sp. FL1651]